MAGTFVIGDNKTRPGVYFNIAQEKKNALAEAVDGITAVVFQADFGPVGKAVELSAEDGYEAVFGNSGGTGVLEQVFAGGAKTIIACRVGNGGTKAEVKLKTGNTEAMSITAKYPGSRTFSITIRTKLSDENRKECMIYTGLKELEHYEFAAGEGNEASALAEAMKGSKRFDAAVIADGKLDDCSQEKFTAGTNPTVTAQDYSDGFAAIEPFYFNTLCVDTEDMAAHLLMQAFMERIFDVGQFAIAVAAEKHDVALETRQEHAAAFNDKSMVYVLNAWVNEGDKEMDGCLTAARIAGMIAACKSDKSLTHTVINDFTELLEPLTPSQMTAAEKSGCLVLSYNTSKEVWIDNAVNTLIDAKNGDDGWKKIRRTKTRYELIYRMNRQAESLIGMVDNDTNGRATVTGQLQAVGTAMVDEGKLVRCVVTESNKYTADIDSAWFDVEVIDKDSLEHVYLTYHFQYSTKGEE